MHPDDNSQAKNSIYGSSIMNKESRFRSDLVFYMLGAIIPGISNFLIILVLKRFLTPYDFGFYSLRMGLALMLSIAGVGWLTLSIVRFLAIQRDNRLQLLKTCLILGLMVLLTIALVSAGIFHFSINDTLINSMLLGMAVISAGIQLIMVAFTQANFNSRVYFMGEILRTLTYLGLAYTVVILFNKNPIPLVWCSYIISNLLGIFFLFSKNQISIKQLIAIDISHSLKKDLKLLFQYGSPLAIWFILLNAMNYIEKPLLTFYTGDYEKVGEFQAMFDIILRGSNIFLLPVSYAIFPHITVAYEQNDLRKTGNLLKKVILLELLALVLAFLLFGFAGFDILVTFFKTPNMNEYYIAGFVMVANAFIWQIAVIVHKPLELNKSTMRLVWNLAYSFLIYLGLLFWLPSLFNFKLAFFALPALIGGLAYIAFSYFSTRKMNIWTAN